uniref:Transcriptional regulator n=1 Tax=Heterorhabditis bacteriophora TaxID=37862 RepID=A0A1I7WEW1_HETBA
MQGILFILKKSLVVKQFDRFRFINQLSQIVSVIYCNAAASNAESLIEY